MPSYGIELRSRLTDRNSGGRNRRIAKGRFRRTHAIKVDCRLRNLLETVWMDSSSWKAESAVEDSRGSRGMVRTAALRFRPFEAYLRSRRADPTPRTDGIVGAGETGANQCRTGASEKDTVTQSQQIGGDSRRFSTKAHSIDDARRPWPSALESKSEWPQKHKNTKRK